jgi:hypothetical protein
MLNKTLKDNIWTYKNIVNKAKMGKKPILIVEGTDDVKKMNLIKQSKELSHKEIEVISIGTFEEFYNKKGAEYVIDFIKKTESHYGIDNCLGYILGIVDRDSICYRRKETKENELLYVLDYYSIENFYVNKEVIEKTLNKIIIEPDLITNDIIENIYQEIINEIIDKLYYVSLEALKKSCQSDYPAIIGYKYDKVDEIIEKNKNELQSKINELNKFAKELNIGKDEHSLYIIVKGKWLISTFCDIYFKKIKELEKKCKYNKIKQCNNCIIDEISEPCLYKPRKNKLNSNDLKEKIYELVDLSSLTPIKERIKKLK